MILPQRPWLIDLCESHHVAMDANLTAANLEVIALIRVVPGSVWDGPLTSWSAEARLLRDYYQQPEDALCYTISEVFRLDAPVPVTSMRTPRGQPVQARCASAGGLLRLCVDTDDARCTGSLLRIASTDLRRSLASVALSA